MAIDIEGIIGRFWEAVDRRGPTECWNYTGFIHANGYGMLFAGKKKRIAAHRFTCLLAGRPIPRDRFACHHCDNRRCVNPAHIYAGSPRDNIMDALSRGRMIPRRGTAHSSAKMNEAAVREIRDNPQISGAALARKFSVSKQCICDIRSRRTWRHVADHSMDLVANAPATPPPDRL